MKLEISNGYSISDFTYFRNSNLNKGGYTMTDWSLVSKGLLGIHWLMECNRVENADLTQIELYSKNFAEKWNNERLLNSGVLMMASYILFVYPQQADFDRIDFSEIDISNFKILEQEKDNSDSKTLCRRLRNSISHAKFQVNEETHEIEFSDDQSGKNKIRFSIDVVSFGNFIDDFSHRVNEQMIQKNN